MKVERVNAIVRVTVLKTGMHRQAVTFQAVVTDVKGSIAAMLAEKFASDHALREEVQLQLERYRLIADVSPIPTVLIARSGENVYVNKAYARIAECVYQDLLDNGWHSILHPDDFERVLSTWNTFRLGTDSFFCTALRIVTKRTRTTIPMNVRAVRIPKDGFAAFLIPEDAAHLLDPEL